MEMKEIYKKIAKENNTTVAEVKREMQFAIQQAYQRDNLCETSKLIQNQIPRKGKIPTPEEMIAFCSEEVKKQQK